MTRQERGTLVPAEFVCRTCARPITHETRTDIEGWYDDGRHDALVCYRAIDYRHVPLEGRERACYNAGYKAGVRAALCDLDTEVGRIFAARLVDVVGDEDWRLRLKVDVTPNRRNVVTRGDNGLPL